MPNQEPSDIPAINPPSPTHRMKVRRWLRIEDYDAAVAAWLNGLAEDQVEDLYKTYSKNFHLPLPYPDLIVDHRGSIPTQRGKLGDLILTHLGTIRGRLVQRGLKRYGEEILQVFLSEAFHSPEDFFQAVAEATGLNVEVARVLSARVFLEITRALKEAIKKPREIN